MFSKTKNIVVRAALVSAAIAIPAGALATAASADPVDNGSAPAVQNVDDGWGDGGWGGDDWHHHHHHWFHQDFDDSNLGSAAGLADGLDSIINGTIGGFGDILGSAG